jgi:ComF family protein
MEIFYDAGNSLRQLFFPHVCKSCFKEIANKDQFLCARCISELPYTEFASLPVNPVEKIFYGRASIEAATSLFFFTPASVVQQLIHLIKYKGQKQLAIYLGKMMGREIRHSPKFAGLDLVVPLPLFRSREKIRGYNQAALLARGISEVLGIPGNETLVSRIKASSTQTRKSREERWKNVDGLFTLSGDPGENRHILLVDDVITTGATLDACANTILGVKGMQVSIMTLAYAMQ